MHASYMRIFTPIGLLLFFSLQLSAQNTALEFDGNGDYVDLGNEAGNGLRTAELWFKLDTSINSTLTDFVTLVARNNGISQANDFHEFDLAFTPTPGFAGKLRWRIEDDRGNPQIIRSDNDTWTTGEWHHVAGVVHPAQGMMMFIDGQKQSQTLPYSNAVGAITTITAVGCWGDFLGRFFIGSIDDVRFSNSALYTNDFVPPCPDLKADITTTGLWNFNTNNGVVAYDSSRNVFNGSIQGATWVNGKSCSGNTLCFDGVDDYVDLGEDAGDGLRTIELWFKPANEINSTSLQDFQSLVVRNNGLTTNEDEFDISFSHIGNSSGKIRFRLEDDIGTPYIIYSDSARWQAGQWYHVAGVVHPTEGMMLFINGKKQVSVATYRSSTASIAKITTIGCWGDTYMRFFEGCVDDVHFASTALYTSDFTPTCPDMKPQATTLGLWNFNALSSSTAIDSSINTFDGILSGTARVLDTVCQSPATGLYGFPHIQETIQVSVYPNPSQDAFYFDLSALESHSDLRIDIYDTQGKQIRSERLSQESYRLSVAENQHGVFIFRITAQGKLVSKGRLVKY